MLHRVGRGCLVVAIILCAALLGSCGSGGATGDERVAEAYVVIVEWVLADADLAPDAAEDESPVVFVESLGPATIDLDVQVDIVRHFEEDVDVRFIDARTEAVDEEADGAPVRDGGILVGLGAMSPDAPHDIRGEVYRTEEHIDGYRFQVDLAGATPSLAKSPESVEPEGLVADP